MRVGDVKQLDSLHCASMIAAGCPPMVSRLPPPSTESDAELIAEAERLLGQGEPLLAYNATDRGLQRWPGQVRLTQLQALALARSGDLERASAILTTLTQSGVRRRRDPRRAGAHAQGPRHARQAIPHNARRISSRRSSCTAAPSTRPVALGAIGQRVLHRHQRRTVAVLRGDIDEARSLAAQVQRICERGRRPDTRVSSRVLAGGHARRSGADPRRCRCGRDHYAHARRAGGGPLRRPQHDAPPGAAAGRAPAGDEPARGRAAHPAGPGLHRQHDRRGRAPGAAVSRRDSRPPCARPCATRLQAASRPWPPTAPPRAAPTSSAWSSSRELGGETHVVLPFPPAEFRHASVDFAAGDWGARFERALAAADSVTIASDHRASGSVATFEYANLLLTGWASCAPSCSTRRCGASPSGIPRRRARPAARPRSSRSGSGAASRSTGRACRALRRSRVAPRRCRGRGGTAPMRAGTAATRSRAALRGCRRLQPAERGPDSRATSTASSARWRQLNRRTQHRFEHVETAGDGLYMVFAQRADAGHYALELNALVAGFDRAACGLPRGLQPAHRAALRPGALRARPDHRRAASTPVPHTSRAARIEPITPPGQVYASSAFAAVAAASGAHGLSRCATSVAFRSRSARLARALQSPASRPSPSGCRLATHFNERLEQDAERPGELRVARARRSRRMAGRRGD